MVRPWSSVMPAAETNAVAKVSRPGSRSSSGRSARACAGRAPPAPTMTWIDGADRPRAIAGEFVTSVRSAGGRSSMACASARPVEDASMKIVDPSSISSRAAAAIASFSGPASRRRAFQPVSIRAGGVRQRPGAAADALQQPLFGEQLEVAVDGHRRDRVLAGEVRQGHAPLALDALEDARPPCPRSRGVDHRRGIAASPSASNRWTRSRSTDARTLSPMRSDAVGGALTTIRWSAISMSTSVRSPSGSTA